MRVPSELRDLVAVRLLHLCTCGRCVCVCVYYMHRTFIL